MRCAFVFEVRVAEVLRYMDVLWNAVHRYQSKLYSAEWLQAQGLTPCSTGSAIDFITTEDS